MALSEHHKFRRMAIAAAAILSAMSSAQAEEEKHDDGKALIEARGMRGGKNPAVDRPDKRDDSRDRPSKREREDVEPRAGRDGRDVDRDRRPRDREGRELPPIRVVTPKILNPEFLHRTPERGTLPKANLRIVYAPGSYGRNADARIEARPDIGFAGRSLGIIHFNRNALIFERALPAGRNVLTIQYPRRSGLPPEQHVILVNNRGAATGSDVRTVHVGGAR